MRKLNILTEYGYPVVNSPRALKENAEAIIKALKKRYKAKNIQFLGSGTSGAMIMAAIVTNENCPEHWRTFGILRKSSEETHRGDITDFEAESPTIVVDDLISQGGTMRRISEDLHEDLRNRVEVVAVTRGAMWADLLKERFPNLKLILY